MYVNNVQTKNSYPVSNFQLLSSWFSLHWGIFKQWLHYLKQRQFIFYCNNCNIILIFIWMIPLHVYVLFVLFSGNNEVSIRLPLFPTQCKIPDKDVAPKCIWGNVKKKKEIILLLVCLHDQSSRKEIIHIYIANPTITSISRFFRLACCNF